MQLLIQISGVINAIFNVIDIIKELFSSCVFCSIPRYLKEQDYSNFNKKHWYTMLK